MALFRNLSLATLALLALTSCTSEPPSSPPAAPTPPLRALERGGGDGPIIVLLHGYGSRPEDLVSFAERTDLPPGSRFVLPYAPESLGGGFAWFALPPLPHDLRGRSLPGMEVARSRLSALLDDLERRHGGRPIVLLGFSQGALVALDQALHDRRRLAGLVLLSSTLVDERASRPLVPRRRGLPVYLSHGESDEVLPFAERQALIDMLREGGMDVRVRTFPGGHVVTPEISNEVAAFIREVTSD